MRQLWVLLALLLTACSGGGGDQRLDLGDLLGRARRIGGLALAVLGRRPFAVDRDRDLARLAGGVGQHVGLRAAERRTQGGDAHGSAVGCGGDRDRVHSALDPHRHSAASQLGAALVEAEEHGALVEDVGLGSVEVLRPVLVARCAAPHKSDDVAAGHIASVSPSGGTEVPVDSTVEVHVSKGPKPVDVPDVRGKEKSSAVRALEKVGLKVKVVEEFSSDEDGGGQWHYSRPVPRDGWPLSWGVGAGTVRFTAQNTPFRHLGFFPDMAPVWSWMREQLSDAQDPECLNLFGYTGVGTLSLSEHGAVTHVDASKKSVAQARANAALSGMEARPVRWIVDDAAKFTAREVRRGKRYDGIILDPPKFGRGPEGEVWRLEESLPGLVTDCAALLDADSRFLFLTVYAVRMSSLALAGLLDGALRHLPGTIEHGDLAIAEEGEAGRVLPTAIFARWRAG